MTPAEIYQQALNKGIDLDSPGAADALADKLKTRTTFFLTFNQLDLISKEVAGDLSLSQAFAATVNTLAESDPWWKAKQLTLAAGGVDLSLDETQSQLEALAVANVFPREVVELLKSKGVQRPTITDADIAAAKVYRGLLIQLKARRDVINRAQERLDAKESLLAANGTVDVPTIEELLA